jgi:hypothetical protein
MLGRRSSLAAILLGIAVGFAGPAHALDLMGQTSLQITWAAATGPVAGYHVFVARNGGAFPSTPTATVTGELATVSGAYGESVVVRVAATDAYGNQGPFSPPSEAFRFVAPTSSGSSGGTGGTGSGGGPLPTPPPPSSSGPGMLPGNTTASGTGCLSAQDVLSRATSVADFDGDGLADVLWRHRCSGHDALWKMGASGVVSEIGLPDQPDVLWAIVGSGDFDGDGHADVLWQNQQSGALAIWLFDGSKVSAAATLPTAPSDDEVAGVADFDGDGRADILWRSARGSDTRIWRMSGTSVLSDVRLPGPSGRFQVVGVGDWNGDGKADVVYAPRGRSALVVMLTGDAGGSRRSPGVSLGMLPAPWHAVAFADFAGNGRDAIWLRNDATGENQLWLTDGNGGLVQKNLPVMASGWTLLAAGDFDGDGKADVLWRQDATGKVAGWRMNADGVLGSLTAPTVADQDWIALGR